ncbi:MAG: VF530 family protein [Candidatus Omnitrophica bacterium]|nr:VF530 family protein [Candidatus Omnitrophota bacterium]
MPHQNLKDPLHGVTLKVILNRLVEQVGWKGLSASIPVRCFMFDPTITSSLRFLRQTPWARKKVEDLYVRIFKKHFCAPSPKGKQ